MLTVPVAGTATLQLQSKRDDAGLQVHDYGEYLDVERHSHLVFELRGDGRTYIANVRVETMSGTGGDVWQAPFTPRLGLGFRAAAPGRHP